MSVADTIAKQLKTTAEEHHHAFAATDGVDPDWPIWYAENLGPAFAELLDVKMTKSELVALLVGLDQEHKARGTDQPWPQFYAGLVAERFVAAKDETLALYHFDGCPYCLMVRRVIDELDIKVELRDVMADPLARQQLIEARGRGTVPVLRCDSPDGVVRWMPESRDIIRYLRQRYG